MNSGREVEERVDLQQKVDKVWRNDKKWREVEEKGWICSRRWRKSVETIKKSGRKVEEGVKLQ